MIVGGPLIIGAILWMQFDVDVTHAGNPVDPQKVEELTADIGTAFGILLGIFTFVAPILIPPILAVRGSLSMPRWCLLGVASLVLAGFSFLVSYGMHTASWSHPWSLEKYKLYQKVSEWMGLAAIVLIPVAVGCFLAAAFAPRESASQGANPP